MRILALATVLTACSTSEVPPPISLSTTTPPAPAALAVIGRVRIAAVGDVMLHRAVKAAARDHATRDNHGGFDWVWADVAPQIRAADLAFANLETPVAPRSHEGIYGQVFNAPADVLPSLAHTGFDVLGFANNHTFDQGPEGLLETLAGIEAAGMTPVGSGRTCSLARAPSVHWVGGMRIAVLALTDLMNRDDNNDENTACTFTSGRPCLSNCGPDRDAIHYVIDEARVLAAIATARATADAVILSFHWGIEYTTEPLSLYRELAPRLIDAGVDVVLGHHPHVLQPIEWHEAPDGRRGLVVYSLGNLVSNMARHYRLHTSTRRRGNTRDGVLLELTITKARHSPGVTRVTIEDVRATPLWTENNSWVRGHGETHVRVVTHAAAAERAPTPGTATVELLAERRAAVAAVVGDAWLAP